MRLARLGLTCYGHFAKQAIALEMRPGCLNLVVAPNGAGKSVLRHGIAELLFGIDPRTPMGFAFGYPKMRLQADAEFAGVPFGFIRRKGDGNTVTDLDGRAADPALLGHLPRRQDRARLERLFMLDSAQLRAGGRALMQSDGDLADALLSGAGELGSARALAADLAAQRDAAAPRRKGKAAFYDACDQWGRAGQALAAALVRPPDIAAREARRAAAVQDRAAANAQAAIHAATLARLARIRSTRRPLLALDEAEAWLANNADSPALPPTAGPAMVAAHDAAVTVARDLATLQATHDDILRELAAVGEDDPALRQAAAIQALIRESGRAQQSHADRPKRAAELAAGHRKLAGLLQQLGLPPDPAAASAAIRPAADIAAARELIAAADQAPLAAAAAEVENLRRKIAEAEEEQAALPTPTRTERLKALLGEATADGDPARRAEAARAASIETEAALASALAQVPRWTGDAAALLALPVPGEAELARLDEAAAAAAGQVDQARRAHQDAVQRLDTLRRKLGGLTAGTLPDAAAIAAARAHRDRGWALVAARLAGQPGDEAGWESGAPLLAAYPRAVLAADALADRRAAESERVAAAAALAEDIAEAGHILPPHAAILAAAQQAHDAAATAWAAAMAGLGLPGDAGPAEARLFLAARQAAIAGWLAYSQGGRHQAALAAQHEAWARALSEATAQPAAPLPALVLAARAQLGQAELAEAQREALAKTLRTLQRQLQSALAAHATRAAGHERWVVLWQAALMRLGRPAGESPVATTTVLDVLVALQAEAGAVASAELRLAEMAAQLDGFGEQARQIAAALGMPGDDPALLTASLDARLGQATAQRARRQTLQDQAAASLERLRAAERAAQTAQAGLADAIAVTGGADLAHAQHRVARAAARAEQEAMRAGALRALAEDGQGRPVEALRADAAGMAPDEHDAFAREAEAAQRAAQDVAQEAAATAERIDAELQHVTDRADAAHAALARQAAAARIARVLEEALVQHTAAAMLEHALAQVEAEGGSNAKLARIGAVFASLTGGAYDHVSPAADGKPSTEHGRLLAHEAGGADKHIAELSEGTRDQLYLALRIVAIEDYAAAGPPLPFIADDILQTFDDTRSLAALRILLALSRHTQVIVLTHHPHLAALAGALPDGTVHLAAL